MKSILLLAFIVATANTVMGQEIIVNGGWGTWNGWSSCSASCGGGHRSRTRNCDNPSPSGGGTQCTADGSSCTETEACNANSCPETTTGVTTTTAATTTQPETTTNTIGYRLVTSGRSCNRITSSYECGSAARAIGLSDTTASDDGQSGVSCDPPYCYYEGGSLKFNSNGTNTGACSSTDKCLCSGQGYYPYGPQTNVPLQAVTGSGWSLCFSQSYGSSQSLSTIKSRCYKSKLMMACRASAGSGTIKLLAWAPREDVLHNTGESDTPHNANGVGWYYGTDESWGFAKQGDPISRNTCDTQQSNKEKRLCWHTTSNSLKSGYRCGTSTSSSQERLIFHH